MKDNGGAMWVMEGPTGMTVRQYYKAAALMGILAGLPAFADYNEKETVRTAALHADAMIAEDRESEANP